MKNLTNLTPVERKFYDKFIELDGLKLTRMFFTIIENLDEKTMNNIINQLEVKQDIDK